MNLAYHLAIYPKLNNLFFKVVSYEYRRQYALRVFERRYGMKPTAEAAKKRISDPLKIRRIIASYQKTLDSRFARMRSLAKRTVLHSFAQGMPKAAGADDGKVGSFNPADPEHAAAEFEGWAVDTFNEVLLDSVSVVTSPAAGHFLIQINAQAIGAAAVQAYERARALGLKISEDLEQFVENVRSVTPANVAATRQFGLLRGITFDAAADIRRELVTGMRNLSSAEDIAAAIDGKLASINLVRARTIARTEITYAHAQATLNAFQRSGALAVEALVEFTLNVTGSAEPCPICESLAGQIYTIEQARGVIPVHPNCQCGWIPVGRA